MKNYLRLFPVFILVGIFTMPSVFADANSEANKCYLDAYNLYKLGKLDESLVLLEKVTTLNPNHPEAHFGRGSIYFRQEKFQKAVEAFTKVTEIKPNYVEAYQRLWLAYKKLGMSEKAEQELLKYRKLIEERMQSMTGGSPQVVKPTSPAQKEPAKEQEKKPAEPAETKQVARPAPEKITPSETTKSPELRVTESRPAEKEPVAEVAKTEVKKQPEPVAVVPVRPQKEAPPQPVVVMPPEPPPVVPETRPLRPESPLVELKYKPHLDTDYTAKYKKSYKGGDPTLKGFIRKLKSTASFLIKNPFRRSDGATEKSYFARLVKGAVYYVVVIQIWLCVAAALCIYFSKPRSSDKGNA